MFTQPSTATSLTHQSSEMYLCFKRYDSKPKGVGKVGNDSSSKPDQTGADFQSKTCLTPHGDTPQLHPENCRRRSVKQPVHSWMRPSTHPTLCQEL